MQGQGQGPPGPPPGLKFIMGSFSVIENCVVYALGNTRVADHMRNGPKSIHDLAKELNADEENIRRMLKTAKYLDIVEEPSPDVFNLTHLGKYLDSEHPESVLPWLVFQSKLAVPLFSVFDKTMLSGKSGSLEMFNEELFLHLSKNPEMRKIFDESMTLLTDATAMPIIMAYPEFAQCKKICDIGGGRGTFLSKLLAKYPDASGVILDVPECEPNAKEYIHSKGMDKKIEFVSGSMFENIPDVGCDLFMYKFVWHNWTNDHIRKTLQCLKKVMKPGIKLLIAEPVIGMDKPEEEKLKHLMDAVMMAIMPKGAHERSLEEIKKLVGEYGFVVNRVIPTRSPICQIAEIVLQ